MHTHTHAHTHMHTHIYMTYAFTVAPKWLSMVLNANNSRKLMFMARELFLEMFSFQLDT